MCEGEIYGWGNFAGDEGDGRNGYFGVEEEELGRDGCYGSYFEENLMVTTYLFLF